LALGVGDLHESVVSRCPLSLAPDCTRRNRVVKVR
jgi:hypothetical protein